jgi:small subunit ribosomal protein S11
MAAKVRQAENAKVYVAATFNNTLVTVTDEGGNTLAWASSGSSGYKGTRKATPYAATVAVEQLMNKVKEQNGVKEVEVFIDGPGSGREASLRAIKATGIKMNMIADITPVPHGGPRPKKRRRT